MSRARPAFYALKPGGWRDYITILHPPYTLWHLSYAAIGAGLAADLRWERLGAVAAAFFLAVGVGAHALDELYDHPLQTRLSDRMLIGIATVSIGGAIAIGIASAVVYDLWLLVFVAAGGFIVVAYNLELFGGAFHGNPWFPLAWGAFPLLTAYFAMTGRLTWVALLAAAFAFLCSLVQRILSTPVRDVRRRVESVSGTITYRDGHTAPIGPDTIAKPAERSLQVLAAATVCLAAALLVLHL